MTLREHLTFVQSAYQRKIEALEEGVGGCKKTICELEKHKKELQSRSDEEWLKELQFDYDFYKNSWEDSISYSKERIRDCKNRYKELQDNFELLKQEYPEFLLHQVKKALLKEIEEKTNGVEIHCKHELSKLISPKEGEIGLIKYKSREYEKIDDLIKEEQEKLRKLEFKKKKCELYLQIENAKDLEEENERW